MTASCYTLHVDVRALPDRAWLESSVRAMEPKFAFVRDFDLTDDSADLACRIADVDVDLTWTTSGADAAPAALAARRSDRTMRLHAGSGDAAEICAAVVAANIALIAGGTLVTPDGEQVEPDDALEWASELIRALRRGKRKPRAKKPATLPPPQDLVGAWLGGLTGAVAGLMMQSLPGDPLVMIRFDNGFAVMARRWKVSTGPGVEHSTLELPRDMSPADRDSTARALGKLGMVLRSGPVRSAWYDEGTFSIRIGFPDGELEVRPEATQYRSREELLLRDGDRWELSMDAVRVYPDMDRKALTVDSR